MESVASTCGSLRCFSQTVVLFYGVPISTDVTHYLWDKFSTYGDVLLEYDDANTLLTRYTLGGDGLIAQVSGGTASYYLPDAQNSTRLLTDATGTVTDTYRYSAYGELLDQTGTTTNAYLYTGQRQDDVTGQYNLRARQYDPAIGRFLSRDAWAINTQYPVELNRYVYAAANPVLLTDPSGNAALVGAGGRYQQISLSTVALSEFGYFVATQHARILISLIAAGGLYAIQPYVDDLAATLMDIITPPTRTNNPDLAVQLANAYLNNLHQHPLNDPDFDPGPLRDPLPNPFHDPVKPDDKDDDQRITLYHYTKATNVPLIYATGLRPSIRIEGDPSSDAQHGNGHYFSDLTPQEVQQFTRAQVSQAFFMTPRKWGITGRLQSIAWISFSFSLDEVSRVEDLFSGAVRNRYPNRGIWLHESTINLPPSYITGSGPIVFQQMNNGNR